MTSHDHLSNTDIGICATIFTTATCGILDYIHWGLTWIILLGSFLFLLVRIHDRFKPFFCRIAAKIRKGHD